MGGDSRWDSGRIYEIRQNSKVIEIARKWKKRKHLKYLNVFVWKHGICYLPRFFVHGEV